MSGSTTWKCIAWNDADFSLGFLVQVRSPRKRLKGESTQTWLGSYHIISPGFSSYKRTHTAVTERLQPPFETIPQAEGVCRKSLQGAGEKPAGFILCMLKHFFRQRKCHLYGCIVRRGLVGLARAPTAILRLLRQLEHPTMCVTRCHRPYSIQAIAGRIMRFRNTRIVETT